MIEAVDEDHSKNNFTLLITECPDSDCSDILLYQLHLRDVVLKEN